MSTLTGQLPPQAVYTTEAVFGLTVEKYHDMIAAGILTTDDRVELLERALICKMAKNPPHVYAAEQVARRLDRVLDEAFYFVKRQEPVTLPDSEPDPDVMVVTGGLETYRARHPTRAEAVMVVEVADTSLRRDRGLKLRVYARSGIAVYWIVNLVDRQIERYAEPGAEPGIDVDEPIYRATAVFTAGQRVPVTIDGRVVGEIAVDDVLP